MKTKVCINITDIPFGVTLYQTGKDRFTVTYGKLTRKGLTYGEAARELGACIMHALACEGKLDNEEPGDD